MASIAKNFAASFIGKIWTASMSLIFLPYYIELIGFEAYGLVGIYTTLLALFNVLDLGLGSSMIREMARLSSQNNSAEEFRNLTRSLEVFYWTIAIFIGVLVCIAAPFITEYWINAKDLSSETIRRAIYCMGLALALLWPTSLYTGGLIGLQKQVLFNSMSVGVATLRGLGMLLILMFVSHTIEAFFLWQIFINALQTTLTAFFLWKNIPKSSTPPRFDKSILFRLKNYAMGIAGVTIIGVLFSQLDKIFLSRLLTLDMFGFYTLAATIASALLHITVPIYSVFFPHFSQLISQSDNQRLIHIYHLGCQLMSSLIIPSALLIIFFSPEILFVWTHDIETVKNTTQLVKLLMTSMMFNALMNLPTALQYAFGWTKLSFCLNLFGLSIMVPLMYYSCNYYGGEGVAWSCVLMNVIFLFVSIQLMHRRIITNEKLRWYTNDVGLPLISSMLVIAMGRLFFPNENMNPVFIVFFLAIIYFLSLTAAFLVSSNVRRWAKAFLRSSFRYKSEI